ncbi:MAG: hypothetical protein E7599_00505 [Ruminococcaceae bacterium]|nr:hypothetical protein [Oscillospiraceae bacterium]
MYHGIQISQTRLIANNIIFTCLLLITVGLGIWYLIFTHTSGNLKDRKRIKRLKQKANRDPYAEKQLQKLKRKQKSVKKTSLSTDILVWSLLIVLLSLNLFLAIIPGWTDYIKKDYVVYEGSFVVDRYTRGSHINLEDGTRLTGALDLGEGEHTGRIVYSRRTKIALGNDMK